MTAAQSLFRSLPRAALAVDIAGLAESSTVLRDFWLGVVVVEPVVRVF